MSRFSATTLDLSRLPVPDVIKDISYDEVLAARIEDLKVRFIQAGIEFDVETLQFDPAVILQQEDAYRELLDKQAINDAVRSVLVSYAIGSNLDALALRFGVVRLLDETDTRLRQRVQLAPEAYSSAGTPGAYRYHALSVSPDIRDIGLHVPAPGRVDVFVLSRAGDGTPEPELIGEVRLRLQDDEIRPLTDAILVRAAAIVPYQVTVKLLIPAGPDPVLAQSAATELLQVLVNDHHRVGKHIYVSAIAAAAHVSNVATISLSEPAADIIMEPDQAGFCTSISVTTEIVE